MSARSAADGPSPADPCYGVEVADDGSLIVAERLHGKPVLAARYASGDAGVAALGQQLSSDHARPRVCVRSCGAAALSVALALSAVHRGEVMLVAPHAVEAAGRQGGEPARTPEERAQRLARLAEHLY